MLADISMARMSGTDLLAEIRHLYSTLPVVMISAAMTDEMAKLCVKSGADACVDKSDIPELVPVLERVLSRHLERSDDGGKVGAQT